MAIPNSSTIAFGLIAGFVVFVTVRGELPSYLCVIGLGANCAVPPPTGNTANSGGTSRASGSQTAPVTTSGSGVVVPPFISNLPGGDLGTSAKQQQTCPYGSQWSPVQQDCIYSGFGFDLPPFDEGGVESEALPTDGYTIQPDDPSYSA